MTASEVEQVLGPATGFSETRYWLYEKLFNPGWLSVDFDEAGRMVATGEVALM